MWRRRRWWFVSPGHWHKWNDQQFTRLPDQSTRHTWQTIRCQLLTSRRLPRPPNHRKKSYLPDCKSIGVKHELLQVDGPLYKKIIQFTTIQKIIPHYKKNHSSLYKKSSITISLTWCWSSTPTKMMLIPSTQKFETLSRLSWNRSLSNTREATSTSMPVHSPYLCRHIFYSYRTPRRDGHTIFQYLLPPTPSGKRPLHQR